MRTFKKAPPTIEFSDGLLLAAWLILATTPISTNSKGSNTVPGLWTGHGGVREALRHKYGDNLNRALYVERCSDVDPAPGAALLPTGPRRFLATERSRR